MASEHDLLLLEKELATQERLQLLSTLKQSFGFLGVVVGLALDKAYSGKIRAAHIVVPPVLLCVLAFVAINANTLMLLTAHLRRVDTSLSEGRTSLPLWHSTVATAMGDWGAVLRRGRFRTMNPYYLLLGLMTPLALIMIVLSIFQSYVVLASEISWTVGALYVVVAGIATLAVLQFVAVFAIDPAGPIRG